MASGKTRIMLFDDVSVLSDQLRRDLETTDVEIVTPPDKYAALRLIQDDPAGFDYVLLDAHFNSPTITAPPPNMPPISGGAALCREMSRVNPTVPIILYTTAGSHPLDATDAVAHGAYRAVTQPEVRQLVADLGNQMRKLARIQARLREIQEQRGTMSHVVGNLGVGFQVVDWEGKVWYRDETFMKMIGVSGRPYCICYCQHHGYPLAHGICTNCLVRETMIRREPLARLFYSPTYPGGASTPAIYTYLCVHTSPVYADPSDLGSEIIAATETVWEVPRSQVDEWTLTNHLRTLAAALSDSGFRRVRIYRATTVKIGGKTVTAKHGLVHVGDLAPSVRFVDLHWTLRKVPQRSNAGAARLASIVEGADFLDLSPAMLRQLAMRPDQSTINVALFDAGGDFIGWVAIDNADGPPATADDLTPPRDGDCVPPCPMRILEEIARVMASKPLSQGDPGQASVWAERTIEKIRVSIVAGMTEVPHNSLVKLLEAVQQVVPELAGAHVRRIEGNVAVSSAHIGSYGRVAPPRLDLERSKRLTARVARNGVPEFIGNIAEDTVGAPWLEEVDQAQHDVLWACASHAMYPLRAEGTIIGTVSFQAHPPHFFTGHQRHLFTMVAGLVASGLRDYLNHLRDEQAIADEFGRRATALILHNINQPVATIRNYVELVRAKLRASAEERRKAEEYLSEVDGQCDRIAAIRDDLRFLFGPRATEMEDVDTRELTRALLVATEHLRGEMALSVTVDAELGQIRTWSHVLRSCLTVLVRNALDSLCDAPAPRSLSIGVRYPRMTTMEEVAFAGSFVAFDVVDSGAGVLPEMRSKLFTPFSSSKRSGLGIGLAYGRQMARAVGGELYFADDSPSGTRFTLVLPGHSHKS